MVCGTSSIRQIVYLCAPSHRHDRRNLSSGHSLVVAREAAGRNGLHAQVVTQRNSGIHRRVGHASAPMALLPAGVASASTVVALWHMNNKSGTLLYDSSGHGNNGTAHNVTPGAAGLSGNAYTFNGKSSYAEVPNSKSLNPGSANITISFYLNTTHLPKTGDYDLVRKGDYPVENYKVELLPSGQIKCTFQVHPPGTAPAAAQASIAVPGTTFSASRRPARSRPWSTAQWWRPRRRPSGPFPIPPRQISGPTPPATGTTANSMRCRSPLADTAWPSLRSEHPGHHEVPPGAGHGKGPARPRLRGM